MRTLTAITMAVGVLIGTAVSAQASPVYSDCVASSDGNAVGCFAPYGDWIQASDAFGDGRFPAVVYSVNGGPNKWLVSHAGGVGTYTDWNFNFPENVNITWRTCNPASDSNLNDRCGIKDTRSTT